ncbi:hypothetical protein RB595_000072 [Gaeumannomyces hyphopodioides]
MASTVTSGYFVESRRVERVVRYHWPAVQLNVWMLIMLIAACTIVGVFATFIGIQSQLLLPIPWYFTYYIIVGSLVIAFIAILLWLIFSRRLLPSIVMIGGFILFVMWLVGLVVVSIELWGPSSGPTGSVSGNCNLAVFSQNPTGQTLQTLAWLEQRSICEYSVETELGPCALASLSLVNVALLTVLSSFQASRGRPSLHSP